MQVRKDGSKYLIRIDHGEKVFETLYDVCSSKNIESATVLGIGAVSSARFGHYNLEEEQYHFTEYNEPLEVVSMTGNLTLKEGKPFLHIHAVFTDTENKAIGGHVEEMEVGVVLEVVLGPLENKVERTLDDYTGLYLCNLM